MGVSLLARPAARHRLTGYYITILLCHIIPQNRAVRWCFQGSAELTPKARQSGKPGQGERDDRRRLQQRRAEGPALAAVRADAAAEWVPRQGEVVQRRDRSVAARRGYGRGRFGIRGCAALGRPGSTSAAQLARPPASQPRRMLRTRAAAEGVVRCRPMSGGRSRRSQGWL